MPGAAVIYQHRFIEPITVHSVEREGDNTVIIGTGGLVFFRPTSHFRVTPQVGELFYIESKGLRILSMRRGSDGAYAFAYTEADLEAQDQAFIANLKEREATK